MNKNYPSSALAYWSGILKSDSANPEMNAFSFEEKYKIIEYAYHQIGLKSNYTYAQISAKLKQESAVVMQCFCLTKLKHI